MTGSSQSGNEGRDSEHQLSFSMYLVLTLALAQDVAGSHENSSCTTQCILQMMFYSHSRE